MYSDMSMRISAFSSSNRYAASALVSSVLPTPVGPKNMNEPIGRLRILQAGARAPHRGRHRLHGLLLADDALGEFVLHAQQLLLLAFQHAVDRHAGPARDHAGDVIGGHGLLDHGAALASVASMPLSFFSSSGMRP